MEAVDVARHSFEEHTSEVELHVVAASLPALFAEAARAVAELMTDDVMHAATGQPESVLVQANDRVALLVAWIDEIVFRSETRKKVYPDVVVESCSERELRATIRGFEPSAIRTAVKAATFYRARVDATVDGFEARVVLDV